MCCFSRPVRHVGATRIFARLTSAGRQALVYEMTIKADEDLAMVLPLPVPPGPAEDAVMFADLSGYPKFFEDLRKGFPVPPSRGPALGAEHAGPPAAKALPVVVVGSFEASFVPRIEDFARLDERFRMPSGVWDRLPGYRAYGFAVFKLTKGEKRIHPMAFTFPAADPGRLFFPTVHVHDGEVRPKAGFDHELYAQAGPGDAKPYLRGFEESPKSASEFVDVAKAKDLIAPDRHAYLKTLTGLLPNEDTWVKTA